MKEKINNKQAESPSRREFLKKVAALGTAVVFSELFLGEKQVRAATSMISNGSGVCSSSMDCSGGGGQCGSSMDCAGGGGKCGSSMDCGGGGGKCGSSMDCAGGGGKCSSSMDCVGS